MVSALPGNCSHNEEIRKSTIGTRKKQEKKCGMGLVGIGPMGQSIKDLLASKHLESVLDEMTFFNLTFNFQDNNCLSIAQLLNHHL